MADLLKNSSKILSTGKGHQPQKSSLILTRVCGDGTVDFQSCLPEHLTVVRNSIGSYSILLHEINGQVKSAIASLDLLASDTKTILSIACEVQSINNQLNITIRKPGSNPIQFQDCSFNVVMYLCK